MSATETGWKTDCRHFEGDRPCIHRRECPDCPEYSPLGRRILVLKIGALGDVLRTTPLLRPLTAGPGPVSVTWVAGESSAPLLRGHPRIHRLLFPGWETSALLEVEGFDLVLSLDKDPYPTAIASRVQTRERRGFGREVNGALVPLHPSARYAYDLGLSDRLKFHENERSYQDITFEVCGLPWKGEEYDVPAVQANLPAGREALRRSGLREGSGPLVGFNTGAGSVFANKAWTEAGYAELARRLDREGCRVVLLGGPEERERNAGIAAAARGTAVDSGTDHSLPVFAGVVAACDLVVTGDTLGMHLAIAAKVPVVVLFGSTCPQEIELYGRGEKVVTPISCHPCYRRTCDISPSCQDLITPDTVHAAVQRVLAGVRR
ncbi:MAG: glycosyltransferase family 9 protein [Candidatus Eiseniibacteriota bacterium]